MGCCASVVKTLPDDGNEYEQQDVYINPSEYDEDADCQVQCGEITYSKVDSDGVPGNESSGMLGMRKRLIVAQAFVMHGINGDPNQYTAEALKESPKLSRRETTRVLQWIDDTIQCALYQHIANNPKKSHVTLRGIASSAKFKNRSQIYSEPATATGESCGVTDSSQTSAPDIALNANAGAPKYAQGQHLTLPTGEDTKSASSNNSRIKPRVVRRASASTDSNFSNRTGKSGLFLESPTSPDERCRYKAFDVRLTFAPILAKVLNMDGALLALNQHCQTVQIARESGSQSFLSPSGSNSRMEELTRAAGLPSFKSIPDLNATKLVDIRELCLKFNVQEDIAGSRCGRVNAQTVTVDCSAGQLQMKDFSDDVSKQLTLLADRSESVASPSASYNRDDSVKTNERGEHAPYGATPFPGVERRTSAKKPGSAPHVLEVPTTAPPQVVAPQNSIGHFGSPTDSSLSWKERTLTFDALKTFVKYQTFLIKQKKVEEVEFDRIIHTQPPTLRTLVFGPYPYSAHFVRPGLIPPNGSAVGGYRSISVPIKRSLQPQPQSGSDTERDEKKSQ